MADPLSIAASVVGLLTAAAQISQILSTVIKKARHAPEECTRIRADVDDIRNILGQLQLFVLKVKQASRSRTSLLMVDQVVATLSSCVLTFSDLQVFVEGLQSEASMGILDRLRWSSKEMDLKAMLSRLETHKSSLTLMLTILTCQLQVDAEDKVDRLCSLIEVILGQNPMLAQRLAAFETSCEDTQTITTQRPPPSEPPTTDMGHLSISASGKDPPDPMAELSDFVQGVQRDARGFAFEELLMNSRAYRNAAHNNVDSFSVVSSAGRTASWSMLSGLSLSEMSNIAILAMPIYVSDISNKEAYDFEPAQHEPLATSKQGLGQLSPDQDEKKSSARNWLKDLVRTPPKPKSNIQPEAVQKPLVFGMPLSESIRYANVAISLLREDGTSFIYGYVPIVVAKAGVFLKEKASDVEDIFALNGNPARMMHLQQVFDGPDRFGKGHDWTGYTVHDAAGLVLRYLKSLPEPVIPYQHYQDFAASFRPYIDKDNIANAVDPVTTIPALQRCVTDLPPLNRQLLLYLLDLLAVFASKSALNKMTSRRLVGVFQPALLSRLPAEMDADEHHLAAHTMVFVIENQQDFLIGMAPST